MDTIRPAIRCEHLSRVYRQGATPVAALRDVSFSLGSGLIACVLGRSGSGKSTLLHVLGGLERADSGQVWIGDRELGPLCEAERVWLRRNRIGFVFQSMNLLPAMRAVENVALPLRYAGVHRIERMRRAYEMLARVGLSARADAPPESLSGGEQQRVALARALVTTPLLVLADEPTGELDTATAAEVTAVFREMNESLGTTFLIVTHDERLAQGADRVFHMEDGRLREI